MSLRAIASPTGEAISATTGTFTGQLTLTNASNYNVYASGAGGNVFAGATSIGGLVGSESLKVTPITSAVNRLEITGGTTGNSAAIYALGSDANIAISISPKGSFGTFLNGQLLSGAVAGANAVLLTKGVAQGELAATSFRSTFQGTADNGPRRTADIWAGFNGGTWGTEFLSFGVGGISSNDASATTKEVLRLTNVINSVNYLQIDGSATGNAVTVSFQGTDANGDIAVSPKGTGVVRFGTYTAGVLTPTGYITVKDAGGTTRRLLVG